MNRTLLNACNPNAVITFSERPGVEFRITKSIGRGASCIVYHAICSDNTEHLLKEYYPKHLDLERDSSGQLIVPDAKQYTFEQGRKRFENGCKQQKSIRLSNEGLKNFTCNVQGYYQANNTEYIDMTCFNGQTYDHVKETSVYDLMCRMKTLAQVIGNYHNAGLLHLDIKPENIYVRPETETVEDVMLFDFDSVTAESDITTAKSLSYTKSWAAREQLLPDKRKSICPATDLFAIGEIIFVQLFGRHSTNSERRSFVTKYSYDRNADIFKDMNPKVFPLLDELLCHTICGVVKQRYQCADELIAKLKEIIKLANPEKPFLKSSVPPLQDFFVGRDTELEEVDRCLEKNPILFLRGIGGIGKSEFAKQYAHQNKDKYDAIIFAPYLDDVDTMIMNDDAVRICHFKKDPEEKPEVYCARKYDKLNDLCDERTLMIVDNLDRLNSPKEDSDDKQTSTIDPKLKRLLELGCKFLITTRMDFTDYGYASYKLEKLSNKSDIDAIFHQYYTKPLSEEEKRCVDEIIALVDGHTMTVELLAKQMMAGRTKPEQMLQKLKEGGIRQTGKEKVRSGKDGEFSRQSSYDHIKTLFDLSKLDTEEKFILANLSLIPYTGIPTKLFHDWCKLESYDDINELETLGWIRWDKEIGSISLHPIVGDICRELFANEHMDCDTLLKNAFSTECVDNCINEMEKSTMLLAEIMHNLSKSNIISNVINDYLPMIIVMMYSAVLSIIERHNKNTYLPGIEYCHMLSFGKLSDALKMRNAAKQFYQEAEKIRQAISSDNHHNTHGQKHIHQNHAKHTRDE